MNQNWKDKMKKHIQDWKNDPKIVRSAKMLAVCIITVIAYMVVAHFDLGIVGLVLRIICVTVLIYIFYQVHKSE